MEKLAPRKPGPHRQRGRRGAGAHYAHVFYCFCPPKPNQLRCKVAHALNRDAPNITYRSSVSGILFLKGRKCEIEKEERKKERRTMLLMVAIMFWLQGQHVHSAWTKKFQIGFTKSYMLPYKHSCVNFYYCLCMTCKESHVCAVVSLSWLKLKGVKDQLRMNPLYPVVHTA